MTGSRLRTSGAARAKRFKETSVWMTAVRKLTVCSYGLSSQQIVEETEVISSLSSTALSPYLPPPPLFLISLLNSFLQSCSGKEGFFPPICYRGYSNMKKIASQTPRRSILLGDYRATHLVIVLQSNIQVETHTCRSSFRFAAWMKSTRWPSWLQILASCKLWLRTTFWYWRNLMQQRVIKTAFAHSFSGLITYSALDDLPRSAPQFA